MKAFSLSNAPHLPVTGASHPLVRESVRWLTAGNAVSVFSALLFCGGLYVWSQMSPEEPPVAKIPGVIIFDDFPTPPPIVRAVDTRAPMERPEADKLATPEPVAHLDEEESNFPSNRDLEWNRSGDEVIDGPVDVVPPFHATQPDTFVAFDELPQLLSIGRPVYPDLVREAGIDGTVLVRVLVTRAGKAKHAVAIEGPVALYESATDAAKTALFRPAKQGNNPVEVWVTVPVTFSLNR